MRKQKLKIFQNGIKVIKMVPAIEGRKVGVNEIPEGYKIFKEEGGRKFYEKITETPPTKTASPGSKKPTPSKPRAIISGVPSKPKTTPGSPKKIPGKRERDVIYTEMEMPPVERPKPSPIKAFIGEHIFSPNKQAFGALINVSRDSKDAATESGLVGPDQEDVFVKYIPGTAKPDLNNVYRMPKGIFSKITGGTIAVQSQEGMDLLEKFKVDPKTVENFKNRLTWTSHL
jgi:hypothetical protein